MSKKTNDNLTWHLSNEVESSEYQKKYGKCLKELSKFVGACANTGDCAAYEFLIIYTTLIFQSGFEALKEVMGEKKSKNLQDFMKKVVILNN